MTHTHAVQVRNSFGPNAEKYARSAAFAGSPSLNRLLEVVAPQPHWVALDVATGGGHCALAVAGRVGRVVATDITPEMLTAARAMIEGHGGAHVYFGEADAHALPFASGTFDLVTCRIAPHHFPDMAAFVRECARAARPGGTVAVIDNIAPGDGFTVRYLNAFEKLRDPSHHWMYPARRWGDFFAQAGLRVTHLETFRKAHDFGDYCERMAVPPRTRDRLRAMLAQAPAGPAAAFEVFEKGGQLHFHLAEVLIVGVAKEA
nr:class I SAM-dependent methyltransferase [Chloroflexota bacterium]